MNRATWNSVASRAHTQIAPDYPDKLVFIQCGPDLFIEPYLITFDASALRAADALGLECGEDKDGSPMLVIPPDQVESLGLLMAAGYKIVTVSHEQR